MPEEKKGFFERTGDAIKNKIKSLLTPPDTRPWLFQFLEWVSKGFIKIKDTKPFEGMTIWSPFKALYDSVIDPSLEWLTKPSGNEKENKEKKKNGDDDQNIKKASGDLTEEDKKKLAAALGGEDATTAKSNSGPEAETSLSKQSGSDAHGKSWQKKVDGTRKDVKTPSRNQP